MSEVSSIHVVPEAPEVQKPSDSPGLDNGRKMAIAAHLIPVLTSLIPFANVIGPLAVWYTQKDKDAFATAHAKAAFNFQATVTIINLSLTFITLFNMRAGGIGSLFAFSTLLSGMLIIPVIMLVVIATLTVAVLKAYEGKLFKYPLCYDFAAIVEKKFFQNK